MCAARTALVLFAAVAIAAFVLASAAPSALAQDFVHPQGGPITSNYYSSRSYGNHGALDIAGPDGSPVTAARDGTVAFAGWQGGYGNLVIIGHEAGYSTRYAHLSSFAVGSGARVVRGQTIGYEGSTGNSTGPHVHFEVRRYDAKQYVPGSVGGYVQRGYAVPHDYPGIGGAPASIAGGGGGGGGGSGSTGLTAQRVTASVLNVRSGPSTGYAIIGQVASGQIYASDAAESGWRRIWFNGVRGYCSGGHLTGTSGVTAHRVTASGLNVRTGPGTGYSVLKVVGQGQVYIRSGWQGDWIQIWFDGQARWFHGAYTQAQGL